MWKLNPNNKKLSRVVPQWRDNKKIYSQRDIKTLLGWDFEVEKIMRFFRERNI